MTPRPHKQVFDALRELMTPPDPPKRPIGFVTPKDKGSKKTSGAKGKTRPRGPQLETPKVRSVRTRDPHAPARILVDERLDCSSWFQQVDPERLAVR